jgi:hypothetical protein
MTIIKYATIFLFIFAAGVPLYAVPATLSLKPGPRPGITEMSINEAVLLLSANGESGWELVDSARALVAERMAYSRRNSFDSPARAFERGYGYCMQHAYALSYLLKELGFEAEVVQAFQNKFPDGMVTSHAWVSVKIDSEVRHIDSLFYDQQAQSLDFTPLSEITTIPTTFKYFTFWGGPAINAHRYYLTGKDL